MWVTEIYTGVAGKNISSSPLQRNYNKNTSIHAINTFSQFVLRNIVMLRFKEKNPMQSTLKGPFDFNISFLH
jgi:hypothetical protein